MSSHLVFDASSLTFATNKGVGFFTCALLGGFIGYFSVLNSRDQKIKQVALVGFIGTSIYSAMALGKCLLNNFSGLRRRWRQVSHVLGLIYSSRRSDRRISNRFQHNRLHVYQL